MGNICSGARAVKGEPNEEVEVVKRALVVPKPDPAEVKTLIVWNDYNFEPVRHDWGHDGMMDNEKGADAFKQVISINDMVVGFELSRQQCTAANVVNAIDQVGGDCDEDDWFVFYYTGHGDGMPDQDGDERMARTRQSAQWVTMVIVVMTLISGMTISLPASPTT